MAAGDRHSLLVNPRPAAGVSGERSPRGARAARSRIEFRRVFTEGIEHGCREARAAGEVGEVTIVMSATASSGRSAACSPGRGRASA